MHLTKTIFFIKKLQLSHVTLRMYMYVRMYNQK